MEKGAPVATRSVVLVEGLSDREAVLALAERRGVDLGGAGVVVQPMGGAMNIAAHLDHFGPPGIDVRVCGLYDRPEEPFFLRGLERAGVGAGLGPADLPRLGFFALDADLEDELIRALGPERFTEVIRAQGEETSWDLFRRQPAQRDRPTVAQMHRWLGTRAGRKIRFAAALVHALDDLDHVPPALNDVLSFSLA